MVQKFQAQDLDHQIVGKKMLNKISDSIVKLLILMELFAIGIRIENAIAINKELITMNKESITEHRRLSNENILLIEKMIDSNKLAVIANGKTIESHKKLSEENLQLNKDQIILLNELKNKK